jgi:hypothetical protein
MDQKMFAVCVGRVVQELPPDLGKAVLAALDNNAFLHAGQSNRPINQKKARDYLTAKARTGHPAALAAMNTAAKFMRAQRGDPRGAIQATRTVLAARRGAPAVNGFAPVVGLEDELAGLASTFPSSGTFDSIVGADTDELGALASFPGTNVFPDVIGSLQGGMFRPIGGGGPVYSPTFSNNNILAGKAGAKLKKGLLAPFKAVHKVTHHPKSPIRKAELALQKAVGKALPFTKPFINAHNKISAPVHKALSKASKSAKGGKLTTDQAKLAVGALKGAKAAALKGKGGKAAQKLLKASGAVAKAAKNLSTVSALSKGEYVVTTPTGKTVRIPASKIAG